MKKEKSGILPLTSYSNIAPYFILTTNPFTFRHAWNYIFTIINKFFMIQLLQKFHITKRKVIFVDTQLDEKIPFVQEKVHDYMQFTNYFVRPISMLISVHGFFKAYPVINKYLDFLALQYSSAAKIYKKCMTTTHRPRIKNNKLFRMIHFFDPHLCCVPSLHVAISSGVWAWFRNYFENTPEFPDKEFRLTEIRTLALKIAESVLFVKQHSVNCVPMSLYMLTAITPQNFFTTKDAISFFEDLFFDIPDEILSYSLKTEIKEHFHFIYEKSLLEHCYDENWQECILRWFEQLN